MSGTPEVPRWLGEALASTQLLGEALRRSMATVQVTPETRAMVARALEQYRVVSPSLERALKTFEANQQAIQRLWRRYAPENWHELQSDDVELVDFVQESGIPVVWAPRAAIIDSLIDADTGERYEVLVASSGEVLDDLDMVLARAGGADVRGHAHACDFADEAIAAARDGHWTAAQALAATGLGQVLHGMHGYPLFGGLGKARKKFGRRDLGAATMMVLKVALLEVCTVKALTDIDKAEPQQFNRHGTQHGDRRFFSPASALGGLLLLIGWIREFTWLAEHGALANDGAAG